MLVNIIKEKSKLNPHPVTDPGSASQRRKFRSPFKLTQQAAEQEDYDFLQPIKEFLRIQKT